MEEAHVGGVGDVAAAHGAEMGGLELAVDHGAADGAEDAGEVDEGDFGGAGDVGEHAFAEEAFVELYAVEATYEAAVGVPDFDAVGIAAAVELGVGGNHVGAEPGAGHVDALLGAAGDDAGEVAVNGGAVKPLVQEGAHGVGDVDFVGEDDEALRGAIPEHLFAAEGEPGEDAQGVGVEQAQGREVAAHGVEAVGVALLVGDFAGVGKALVFVVKLIYDYLPGLILFFHGVLILR